MKSFMSIPQRSNKRKQSATGNNWMFCMIEVSFTVKVFSVVFLVFGGVLVIGYTFKLLAILFVSVLFKKEKHPSWYKGLSWEF